MLEDMAESRDKQQYGNEKGISINHLLINLLHKILTAVDKNSKKEKFAVILNLLDYSQAFERVSHQRGIHSFIQNNVRPSLIPVLISFFENRSIQVKWNGHFSETNKVNGGSAQGISAGGVLEYLSLTNGNLSFLEEEEAWKYINDSNFIEIINLTLAGLSSFDFKHQVPSDIATHDLFLSSEKI